MCTHGVGMVSNKAWAKLNDPDWGLVVVTGHNKYNHTCREGDRVGGKGRRVRKGEGVGADDVPNFVASHRIGFHSCSCQLLLNPKLSLHCALLPCLSIDPTAAVEKDGERNSTTGRITTEFLPPDFFSVSHWEKEECD